MGSGLAGDPPLLCSANLKTFGFIPEMIEKECLWASGEGLQLRRGQTCVTVICDDGREDDYYCGKEQTLAALLPELPGVAKRQRGEAGSNK